MNDGPDIFIVCYKSCLKFTNNVVFSLQTAIDLASFPLPTRTYIQGSLVLIYLFLVNYFQVLFSSHQYSSPSSPVSNLEPVILFKSQFVHYTRRIESTLGWLTTKSKKLWATWMPVFLSSSFLLWFQCEMLSRASVFEHFPSEWHTPNSPDTSVTKNPLLFMLLLLSVSAHE